MIASPRWESSVPATRSRRLVSTGLDVLPIRETAGISDDTLTRDDVVFARAGLAGRHSNRSDTIGVTEGNYSETCQHSDAGVCALGLLHKSTDRIEYILLIDPDLPRLLKVVGEDVEEKLGIGRGVDVPVGIGIHETEQGVCIDQVTILSVGRIRRMRGQLERCFLTIRIYLRGRIRCRMAN